MSDTATVQLSPYMLGLYNSATADGRFGVSGAASLAVDGKPIKQAAQDNNTATASNGNVSISLYGQLSQIFDTFHTGLKDSSLPVYAAGVSDLSIASASITGAVNAASLTSVSVSQLAQHQKLLSNPFEQSSTVIGYGSLTLETGRYDNSSGSFTPTSATRIDLAANGATLQNIADSINQSGAPVKARIIQASNGAQLQLESALSGNANTIRLTVNDRGDGNNTDSAGLSRLAFDPAAAQGSGQNLKISQQALDALYSIDGSARSSSSNTVPDLVTGVTVTLKQTGTFSLSTSTPFSGILQTANGIVSAYNQYVDSLSKLGTDGTNNTANTAADFKNSQASKLLSDSSKPTDWLKQQTDTLNQFGIGWQDNNSAKLLLNDSKLFSQWSDNPFALQQGLRTITNGLLGFGLSSGSTNLSPENAFGNGVQNAISQYYQNNSGLNWA